MEADTLDGLAKYWYWTRRVVTFVLGVVVILDSLLVRKTANVGNLIVGLFLIGVLPLDDLVRAWALGRARPDRTG